MAPEEDRTQIRPVSVCFLTCYSLLWFFRDMLFVQADSSSTNLWCQYILFLLRFLVIIFNLSYIRNAEKSPTVLRGLLWKAVHTAPPSASCSSNHFQLFYACFFSHLYSSSLYCHLLIFLEYYSLIFQERRWRCGSSDHRLPLPLPKQTQFPTHLSQWIFITINSQQTYIVMFM